jgi:hypothetical protein
MPRPRPNPAEAKLKRQQSIQRYGAKPEVRERIRAQDRSYRQKKKEQAQLRIHQDPLAQLADIVTQQRYLQEAPEALDVPEPTKQRQEPIDEGITVEEDGEILENFSAPLGREWEGGADGEFPDEPESDVNDGLDCCVRKGLGRTEKLREKSIASGFRGVIYGFTD